MGEPNQDTYDRLLTIREADAQEELPAARQRLRHHLPLTIPLDTTTREPRQALHTHLLTHPGQTAISVRFQLPQEWDAITTRLSKTPIDPTATCLNEIRALIGDKNLPYIPWSHGDHTNTPYEATALERAVPASA